MLKVEIDIDDILTIDDKKAILKDIQHPELIKLFNNYTPRSLPKRRRTTKKPILDQRITVGITSNEKEKLEKEVSLIQDGAKSVSMSWYVRNQVLNELDMKQWAKYARSGLQELIKPDYDKRQLTYNRNKYVRLLDKLVDDEETEKVYKLKINEYNDKLKAIAKSDEKRYYSLSGRITYSEANIIRYRAARLSLTVADYIRMLVFQYVPFSDGDKHINIDARKRFYISVLDVYENGWGEPPAVEECSQCAKTLAEIHELKKRLHKYEP